MAWQKASGYNERARAKTAMSRFKRVIGDGLGSMRGPADPCNTARQGYCHNHNFVFITSRQGCAAFILELIEWNIVRINRRFRLSKTHSVMGEDYKNASGPLMMRRRQVISTLR